MVVDALVEARPGMTVGWTPSIEHGATFIAHRARPGDVALTVGAGDVDRAVPLLLENSHEDRGRRRARSIDDRRDRRPARHFARPKTRPSSSRRSSGQPMGGSTSSRSVSARTCSLRTPAWTRSCSGSRRSWPGPASREKCSSPAAGPRTPSAHTGRAAGLVASSSRARSLEPWRRWNAGPTAATVDVLERALVVSATGSEWRTPAELGLEYRRSRLAPGEVVAAAEFRLRPRHPRRSRRRWRAPGAAEGGAADEQAHLRKCLQESRPRAVGRANARGVRTEGLPDRRRSDLSPARELHRERRRGSGWRRLALMIEARRRALEQFGVELSSTRCASGPARASRAPVRRCRASAARAELGCVPASASLVRDRRARAAEPARRSLSTLGASSHPAGRWSSGSPCSALQSAVTSVRARGVHVRRP